MRVEPESPMVEVNVIDLAAGDVFRPVSARDSLYIVAESTRLPLRFYVNLWTGKTEEVQGRVNHFPNASIRTNAE